MTVWVVFALVAGLVLGAVGAIVVRGRSSSDRSPSPSTTTGSTTADVAGALREAVAHLETGVLISDPSGEITYRNAAAGALRGTHAGVLVDDRVALLDATARSGTSASAIVELHGPPKTWLEMSSAPLPNGGAVTTIHDVSERMRTDAMRSDFVSNVSHELKTPVGAIAVLAEALIDETDPQVVSRFAGRLVDEAHRAADIIDDLLVLAEIESAPADDRVVDLGSVVTRAIERGRAVDNGRGVQITDHEMQPTVLVRGDDQQLVSAVGNLVENAVKYSRPGDVVRVSVQVDDDGVEVAVVDEGIGIPARDHDRIFERFYRVDRARSRDTGGTGLGLSIVRRVAVNHGGDVALTSYEGEGSTFVFRLPMSTVVERDVRPAVGREQPER